METTVARHVRSTARIVGHALGGVVMWLVLTAQAVPPPGWWVSGRAMTGYEVRVDAGRGRDGGDCLRIEGWKPGANSFISVSQFIDATQWSGQRLRVSGWIRVESVEGWSGLWMRLDDETHKPLAFDNMEHRPIRGTAGWRRHEVILDVPEKAAEVAFGLLLSGRGTVYLDDVTLEPVKGSVPVTRPSMAEIDRRREERERRERPARSGEPREEPEVAVERPEAPEATRTRREIPPNAEGWNYADAAKEGGYEVRFEPNDQALDAHVAVRNLVERPPRFLDLTRWVDGRKLRGRRVRLTARIKSEEMRGWTGLYLRADGVYTDEVLSFETMQNHRPVVGTRDWRRYELVHEVPDDAEHLFFGLIVDGPGKVWMKDLELVPVSGDVALTARTRLQPKPSNLDFERDFEAAPKPGGIP